MKQKRILKKITVIEIKVKNDKRFNNKTFKSYKAVANTLKIGEKVIVRVVIHQSGSDFEILDGYGEVEKVKNGYFEPRRLSHDY